MVKSDGKGCCRMGRFPTLAIILLVIGIGWLLNDLNVIEIPIPWVPVVLIMVAIGMIVNRYGHLRE
jgi:hypothetical protein